LDSHLGLKEKREDDVLIGIRNVFEWISADSFDRIENKMFFCILIFSVSARKTCISGRETYVSGREMYVSGRRTTKLTKKKKLL